MGWAELRERRSLPQLERAPAPGIEDLLVSTLSSAVVTTAPELDQSPEVDSKYVDPLPFAQAIYCSYVVFSLIGLITNAAVLWFLGFRIKRNPLSVYILNLAAVQFVFLFAFSIVALIFLLSLHGVRASGMPYEVMQALYMFGFLTSQCLLTAMSVEWCLSFWCPVWYRRRRSKHQSRTVCAAVWVLSCFVVVLWHLFCGYSYHACLGMFIGHCVLDVLICIPLMLLSSLTMLIKICRRQRGQQPPKLYILLFITVLAFLLLTVPAKLVVFLKATWRSFAIAVLCFCINSSFNPVIYYFVGSLKRWRLKQSVPGALQKAFQDESELPLPVEHAPVQRRCVPA
ncbi:hypothetical protein NDU88_000575 [Pleurodeles waltl]|uniref:G-protein coupled receptors family 1 profile domain-containing protein n=1 Tax=Pleurodeles waltl TaxID=8319 RepID=A0AAV7SX05_PLEWA|nr:hypothetical protein NDU88_000575 [Pleurodeles waltl]